MPLRHQQRLADCRRVVLFNYNSDDQTIDFRHYVVGASPVGLTKVGQTLNEAGRANRTGF